MSDFSIFPNDRCLKTSEAAEYLGLSPTTLKSYRADGIGPEYVQFGIIIRYRLSDLKKWCEAHISTPSIKRK
jgi:predicted DNA-binding transcriptional regulator AlpA